MKIAKAIYKTQDIETEVWASEMTHADYIKKYRGFLYCAESDCNAKLCFLERKKSSLKVFKTWPKSHHKTDCPNEVSYKDNEGKAKRRNGEIAYNISNDHIAQRLKAVFEKLHMARPLNGKSKRRKGVKHEPGLDGIENSTGVPTLFNKGIDKEGGREAYILERSINTLDDTDIDKVRVVFGPVNNIQISDTHGYINYQKNSEYQAKVHFSKYFRDANEGAYRNFDVLKTYFRENRKHGDIICCCVGIVKKTKNGFNIHPDRAVGFTINGMTFYDILREINDL